MPGPPPLPTSIRRLRGNPGKQPLPKPGEEPEPAALVALGDPPEFIGEHGAREWRRVGPVLIELGLLTEADLAAFTTYCAQLQILVTSMLDIQARGMTIQGARGEVRNPSLASMAAASTTMLAICKEFGMTPSSRSRIRLPGEDDAPTLADLLGPLDFEEDAAE